MSAPVPLHRLRPAAQSIALEALHRARRGQLYVTITLGAIVWHAWWARQSGAPTALWPDGSDPVGPTCDWPRKPMFGVPALTEDEVDKLESMHEADELYYREQRYLGSPRRWKL